jgi:hypothetical protein
MCEQNKAVAHMYNDARNKPAGRTTEVIKYAWFMGTKPLAFNRQTRCAILVGQTNKQLAKTFDSILCWAHMMNQYQQAWLSFFKKKQITITQ